MLEGFHFINYAMGPLIIYTIISFFYERDNYKEKSKNIFLLALSAGVISSLWYLPAVLIGNFEQIFSTQFAPAPNEFYSQSAWLGRLFDKVKFINKLILPINSAIFIIFLSIYLFVSKYKHRKLFKLFIIVGGAFILPLGSLIFFKLPPVTRYLLPLLPSISITMGVGIWDFFRNFKKYYIYIFMVVYLGTAILFFMWQFPVPKNSYELMSSRNGYGILTSHKFDPKVNNIVKFLDKKTQNLNSPPLMLSIISDNLNPAPLCLDLFHYKIIREDINISFIWSMMLGMIEPLSQRQKLTRKVFNEAKYILYIKNKGNIMSIRSEYHPENNKMLKNLLFSSKKKLIGIFKAPNNFFIDDFYLYKVNN